MRVCVFVKTWHDLIRLIIYAGMPFLYKEFTYLIAGSCAHTHTPTHMNTHTHTHTHTHEFVVLLVKMGKTGGPHCLS